MLAQHFDAPGQDPHPTAVRRHVGVIERLMCVAEQHAVGIRRQRREADTVERTTHEEFA